MVIEDSFKIIKNICIKLNSSVNNLEEFLLVHVSHTFELLKIYFLLFFWKSMRFLVNCFIQKFL